MKKSLIFLGVCLVAFIAFGLLRTQNAKWSSQKKSQALYDPWIQRDGAYQWMNIPWGASPKQVETAIGRPIEPVQDHKKYYTIKNASIEPARYRVESARLTGFLGREVKLVFVFFDQKLFSYHALIWGQDPVELDQTMQAFALDRFGSVYSSVHEDGSPLRAIWNLKNVFVNYWFYKDTLSLSLDNRFWAGFGVINRALENAIQ